MATNEIGHPRAFKVKHTSSSGDLTGEASGGARTFSQDVIGYAADAKGGLLDPYAEAEYVHMSGAQLKILELYLGLDGHNTAWSVHKVDKDGTSALWLEGAVGTEGEQFWLGDSCPPLLLGEKIKIVTTGCIGDIPCWIVVAPVFEV